MPESDLPVAVVTGASGGMGGEIVRSLARDHRVIALGRSVARLAPLAELDNVETRQLELESDERIADLAAGLDRLDVLVHAAAVATNYSVAEAEADEWRRQWNINVVAPALLTRLTLPLLRASRGTVVLINSGAGTRGAVPGSAVYSATKFGLKALADALRAEEAGNGVKVATVAPGPTDTEMYRETRERAGLPFEPEKLIKPGSVAAAVRLVVDAGDDTQITDIAVRPRRELS